MLNLVPFVSVDHMMKLVLHLGVERVLTDLVAEIEADFRRWPLFDKTPRIASHSDIGVIELMPTSDGETYGFKYVNGHPGNMKKGLQTLRLWTSGRRGNRLPGAAVGDDHPHRPAHRRHLRHGREMAGPKGATTMAMIGNGAQAEFQALGFKAICGITEVRLYDIDPAATAKCVRNLAGRGLTVTACRTPEEAMEGAQIITTCTADKTNATILTDNMVGTGVHINGVGGDCPARPNSTATSCCGRRSSSNTQPRPASRARSSSFPPTTR